MEISKKLFFIGSGNMAQAIIGGLLKTKLVKAQNIVCNDIVKEKVLNLGQKFGISIAEDKRQALINADIVFLSVKPESMLKVFSEIKDFIRNNTIIISIAAGITTKFIEENIKKKVAVIRAMPNMPALVCCGITALCKGRFVSGEQMQKAKDLFASIGKTEALDEQNFDIITALSGSGPGYVFYLCELMQQAACQLGLSQEIAKKFAIETVYGAGKMLEVTGESASVLKEQVKSPNGTTEAALKYFESQDFSNTVYNAMFHAMEKAKELNK